MALSAKVGTLSCPGSTGNQAITGVGFQPKAVLFWGNKRTSAGTSSSQFQFYVGMATSSSSRACSAISNGAFRTDNLNTKCIFLKNDASTTVLTADLTSMDADGFTLNWSVVSSGVQVNYLALGGSDLTNAAIKQLQAPASTGSQAYTGVGFRPDAVIAVSVGDTATPDNGSLSRARFGMGAASGSSAQWATSSEWEGGSANGYQRTNQVIAVIGNGAKVVEANLTSFDSDGFTLNWGTTTNGVYCWFLCLKGGQFKAGSISQKTSTGNQAYTGVGFQPVAELFASRDLVASTTIDNNEEQTMIGAASSTSARAAIISNWGGLSTDQNTLTTTKAIRLQTGSTPTVQAEADLVSHDSDGFTLNWTTADATAREIVYLAFGSAAGGGVTGTISSTLTKATSSFSGTHKQTGTIAATATKATSAFTGVMNPSGSFASTMRKATSAFTGSQGISGVIAGIMQKATSAWTGTQTQTGTITSTLQRATSSFTGVMNPSGVIASIMTKATAAFSGTQTQTGSIASILTKATSAFSGSVGSGVSGSIASTVRAATSAWTATQTISGTLASTIQRATSSFTGVMNPSGTIASRMTKATSSFAGTQTITGTIASTLTKATSSFTGAKSYLGTIASTMAKATSSFTGVHKQTGIIASTLRVVTSAWSGSQPFTGTIASILTKATALFTAYNREPSYTALSREILEIPRYNAVLEIPSYNDSLEIPRNNEVLNGN